VARLAPTAFSTSAHAITPSPCKQPLQEGADIDAQTTSGVTALWLAAGEGREDVLRYLLSKKTSVHCRRSDGITAVMAAAVGGHKDVVRLLAEEVGNVLAYGLQADAAAATITL
jgi:ankyrin repeat protein